VEIQKTIADHAKELRGQIREVKGIFKWLRMRIDRHDMFRQHYVLKRLALWLMDVNYKHVVGKKKKTMLLPFVLF